MELDEEGNIRDIEDLLVAGETHKICPYYFEREHAQEADLIILPYSYILDPRLREDIFPTGTPMSLENKIIIFDEAHNLEKSAQDGISFTLTPNHLEKCL